MTIDRAKFQFTSDLVPRGYDEYLVPRLFHPWAEALVQRLAPLQGGRALDVACGPGTVARVLAKAIGPRGQVAGLDSSAAMIAQAGRHPEASGAAPIAYTVGPAVPLPFPEAAFDTVTCQQGLQFFPDAREALAEMRRVLTPDGRCGASVWLPLAESPVFHAFGTALAQAGLEELAGLLSIPFPHWSPTELADRGRGAGFGRVSVNPDERDLVFPGGVDQAIQAFTGTPLGPMLVALEPEQQARLRAAAVEAYAGLCDRDGSVRGPMRSWVLIASA